MIKLAITFITINDLDVFIKYEKTLSQLVSEIEQSRELNQRIIPLTSNISDLLETGQKMIKKMETLITKIEKLETGEWV